LPRSPKRAMPIMSGASIVGGLTNLSYDSKKIKAAMMRRLMPLMRPARSPTLW